MVARAAGQRKGCGSRRATCEGTAVGSVSDGGGWRGLGWDAGSRTERGGHAGPLVGGKVGSEEDA